MEQDKEQSLRVQSSLPHFSWPTSKPGPHATQPPPGQKPVPGRTDQVEKIGYNQETGTPSAENPPGSIPDESLKGRTASDQQETAQEALKKRKRK
ncbi:MAG: hypothetical protein AUH89_00080 [Ktedonobacter sp. 13_1_40CM_4_52_4]|nr:MAG: hypothetical protein AUH89_00080 [Ktedonobacter sp. 13_1_40CM_4_52_4]